MKKIQMQHNSQTIMKIKREINIVKTKINTQPIKRSLTMKKQTTYEYKNTLNEFTELHTCTVQ